MNNNNLNMNNRNMVRPVIITSPISGNPVTPRIIKYQRGNETVTEAHWIDPNSGTFIRKGVVSIELTKK
jgi:hypothetical protein